MKKAKNLLLISVGVIILGMSILYSCKNYTGPSNGQGLFADKEKANNVDSGEDSAGTQMLTPDSQRVVVWADSGIIPALTVTKDNTLIAAVGDKTTKGKILIKTSKDLGKTWTSYSGEIKSDKINNGIAHPFFINCHNGDILLGIATTNTREDTVFIEVQLMLLSGVKKAQRLKNLQDQKIKLILLLNLATLLQPMEMA